MAILQNLEAGDVFIVNGDMSGNLYRLIHASQGLVQLAYIRGDEGELLDKLGSEEWCDPNLKVFKVVLTIKADIIFE